MPRTGEGDTNMGWVRRHTGRHKLQGPMGTLAGQLDELSRTDTDASLKACVVMQVGMGRSVS